MRKHVIVLAVIALMVGALAAPAGAAKPSSTTSDVNELLASATGDSVDVLISTDSYDYADAVAAVEAAGGTVTHQFSYAQGIAATIPASGVAGLFKAGVGRVGLDQQRTLAADTPEDLDGQLASETMLDTSNYQMTSLDAGAIDTYWSYAVQDAGPVWDEGDFGQGSLIAVIDTGILADHVMFSDGEGGSRVVGGVDLSTDVGTAFEGYSSTDNYYHGTHVAGIAAGAAVISAPSDDPLVESIEYNADITLPDDPTTVGNKIIPLLGMAPEAGLFAIKVFDHTGGSASESTIIAGIEYAIDQKVAYDESGGTDGYDIDVINMSLGGWNGYDGRDLEDQVVDYATSAGITVASAASNDGPYQQSIQSPGTANTSITVGAIADPVHARVYWDLFYDEAPVVGLGQYLYVDDDPQVIYFSSRGQTADGRNKPDVSAIGVFVLSADSASQTALSFSSGTSMATPQVAGLAALLNSYGEDMGASPYDYKQAIVAGASMVPDFDEVDQGAGLIDAGVSLQVLMADHHLGEMQPELRTGYSARMARPKGTYLQKVNATNGTTFSVSLEPGMQEYYYFQMPPNAERVTLDVSNVDLGLDLGLNSFELYLQGGVNGANDAYIDTTNVYGDASFIIEDGATTASGDIFGAALQDLALMPGYWKLVIENDWTSFDTISGTFTVNVESGDATAQQDESYSGKLTTGDSYGFFQVAEGQSAATLELSWKDNFQRYSTTDLDLIVIWVDTEDNQHLVVSGATVASPEMATIDGTYVAGLDGDGNPIYAHADVAAIYALVDGYNTYGKTTPWTLDVYYK